MLLPLNAMICVYTAVVLGVQSEVQLAAAMVVTQSATPTLVTQKAE